MTELTPEKMELGMMFVEGVMQFNKDNRLRGLSELNRAAKPDAVVFLGDSITEGLAVHELLHSTMPLYNRGIGGYTSQELLDAFGRLTDGLCAKKVFLLIGTNDLANPETPIPEIAARIVNLVKKAQAMNGAPDVYLLSVLPVTNKVTTDIPANMPINRRNGAIDALNLLLRDACAGQEKAYFLDVAPHLRDEDGDLKTAYTYDGLHLTLEGYQALVEVLQPLL